jgi:hypothetical protein
MGCVALVGRPEIKEALRCVQFSLLLSLARLRLFLQYLRVKTWHWQINCRSVGGSLWHQRNKISHSRFLRQTVGWSSRGIQNNVLSVPEFRCFWSYIIQNLISKNIFLNEQFQISCSLYRRQDVDIETVWTRSCACVCVCVGVSCGIFPRFCPKVIPICSRWCAVHSFAVTILCRVQIALVMSPVFLSHVAVASDAILHVQQDGLKRRSEVPRALYDVTARLNPVACCCKAKFMFRQRIGYLSGEGLKRFDRYCTQVFVARRVSHTQDVSRI